MLLARGYKVAATSRIAQDLQQAVDEHEHFLPLQMNLSDENDVQRALTKSPATRSRAWNVIWGYGKRWVLRQILNKLFSVLHPGCHREKERVLAEIQAPYSLF
ncbi:hypothetical protein [Paenibacillus jiagnxiensis]|uniref:hypothetical protein n=1 Tax=Paenibacillus jiagnxiensis TaxID=3228926 RepID=UPI0033BB2974